MNYEIDSHDIKAFIKLITSLAYRHRIPCEYEDFVQDLLLNLLQRRLPRYINKGWLCRFVAHRAVDVQRMQARRPVKADYDGELENFSLVAVCQGPESSDDSTWQQGDPNLKPLLSTALSLLSTEQQRTMMLLASGYSYQDIASITGTKLGTVRSRIYYARQRLAPLMVADAS